MAGKTGDHHHLFPETPAHGAASNKKAGHPGPLLSGGKVTGIGETRE